MRHAITSPIGKILFSSLGKKVLAALSGLGLFVFVVVHLLGNLSFMAGPEAFNAYSHKLLGLGPLLYAVELGLVAILVLHAFAGISVYRDNLRARGVRYRVVGDAGDPSVKSLSSRSMIYTGLILLVFTVIHLKTFKYGPGHADGYVYRSGGEEMRDLYRLVVEVFHSPWYTFGYVGCMILLGFHLRHGFWSALQSLGTMHPKYSKSIYRLGVILSIVIAFGFLFLPLYVYFT